MTEFLKILSLLGVSVDLNVDSLHNNIIILASSILVLAVVGLLCFMNLIMYYRIFYIFNNKQFLEKISNYRFLLTVVEFIKRLQVFLIILEINFLLVSLGSIIWLCLKLIYGLS